MKKETTDKITTVCGIIVDTITALFILALVISGVLFLLETVMAKTTMTATVLDNPDNQYTTCCQLKCGHLKSLN